MHPVAGRGPDAAVRIHAEPVEKSRVALGDYLASGQAGAVGCDPVPPDMRRPVRVVGASGIGNIKECLIGRETDPVRLRIVVGDTCHGTIGGVDPVDMAGTDLARRAPPLVIHQDAVVGIGEPDRPVGAFHDIVRRVELPALVIVGKNRNRAVMSGAGDPPRQMLAGDKPPLAVGGVAVAVHRRRAEDRDRTVGVVIAQHAVVRNVGPDEIAPAAEPGRSLAPAAAGPQPLDMCRAEDTAAEFGIDDLVACPFQLSEHAILRFVIPQQKLSGKAAGWARRQSTATLHDGMTTGLDSGRDFAGQETDLGERQA